MLLLSFAGQSARAAAEPAPAASAPCELHVWPAAATHTSYTGWFHGGYIDGYERGVKGYPNMYADAIDMAQQVKLLGRIDWKAQMGDAALQVTIHEGPTGSEDDRQRTTRLIAGGGSCYRELIFKSSIVDAATFSTRSVRLVAIRKSFGQDAAAPVNFTAMTQGVITVPAKTDQEFDARMRAAVQDAFLVAAKKFVVAQSFH